MKGKGRPITDKLSKISEGSTFQQYTPNPPMGQSGRVSLSSLATRKPERKGSSVTIRQDELTLEERDAKIKGLQEAIMDKKQTNDAIQLAFTRRKESPHFLNQDEFPRLKLAIIAQGCAKITCKHISLKKSLLRALVSSLRQSKSSKAKSVRILLIWLVSCLSRLFTFLSRPPAPSGQSSSPSPCSPSAP